MKKTLLALLVLGALVLGACATIPRSPLSDNDLAVLKGRWEGARDMIWGRWRSHDHTVLEIYNQAVPLRGKIRIAFMEGSDPRVYAFEDGAITPEGDLSVQVEKGVSSFLLSLYREEKRLKLDGYYRQRSNEGRLTLYKDIQAPGNPEKK